MQIKYKKCRLKPGAIPIVGIHFDHNSQNSEEANELKVNRIESDASLKTENCEPDNKIRKVKPKKTYTGTKSNAVVAKVEIESADECYVIPTENSNDDMQTDSENVTYYSIDEEYIFQPAESPSKKQMLVVSKSENDLESIVETVEIMTEEDKMIYITK